VWLGSVAALLEGLGFGERFVRTALSSPSRLVE
jgi:phenylacetic acid degradation operon negative regulatory protein